MSEHAITRNRLKQIVVEEYDKLVSEATIDHASIKDIVAAASKLLTAVEKFRSMASPTMMSSVGTSLDKVEKTLEDMVATPGSYVVVPKKVRQRVSLKPAAEPSPVVR